MGDQEIKMITDEERDRSVRKYAMGLSALHTTMIVMIVFMSVLFGSVLLLLTIFGLKSNTLDIMIILSQVSSFLPLLSMNIFVFIPLVTVFSLIKPSKKIQQLDEWKIKRAGTLFLLAILIPGFTFFIFLTIIKNVNPSDISGFMMGTMAFLNIFSALVLYFAFIYPVQDMLDEKRRRMANLILILWMVPPVVFAFDGAFMFTKLILPVPRYLVIRIVYYILIFIILCIPLGIMARLYSWAIRRLRGREKFSKSEKPMKGWVSKGDRFLWKMQRKPRYLASIVIVISLGFGILNGFVGELDPIDLGGLFPKEKNDPYDEFMENGIIDGDWIEDYLNEGEEKQWIFDIDSEFYFVWVYLYWEDEGDYVRWVNTPDEFQLTVEIFQDDELIDSGTSTSDDGDIEIEIDKEEDPVFVTRMVVTITLIDAGDYNKRIGPGIFEELRDEGNDMSLDLVFAYLWNES